MDPFDKLSPELCLIVLTSDPLLDMTAATQASPALRRKTGASAGAILTNFIRAYLPGDALQDALAVLHFPRQRSEQGQDITRATRIAAHLQAWGDKALPDPCAGEHPDYAVMSGIHRMYARFWRFIKDYLSKATSPDLPSAYSCLPEWSHSSFFANTEDYEKAQVTKATAHFDESTLTGETRLRIFRAFLQYEMLCQVYCPLAYAEEHVQENLEATQLAWDWELLAQYRVDTTGLEDPCALGCVREYIVSLYQAMTDSGLSEDDSVSGPEEHNEWPFKSSGSSANREDADEWPFNRSGSVNREDDYDWGLDSSSSGSSQIPFSSKTAGYHRSKVLKGWRHGHMKLVERTLFRRHRPGGIHDRDNWIWPVLLPNFLASAGFNVVNVSLLKGKDDFLRFLVQLFDEFRGTTPVANTAWPVLTRDDRAPVAPGRDPTWPTLTTLDEAPLVPGRGFLVARRDVRRLRQRATVFLDERETNDHRHRHPMPSLRLLDPEETTAGSEHHVYECGNNFAREWVIHGGGVLAYKSLVGKTSPFWRRN